MAPRVNGYEAAGGDWSESVKKSFDWLELTGRRTKHP